MMALRMLVRTLVAYVCVGCVMLLTVPLIILCMIVTPERRRTKNALLYRLLDLLYRGVVRSLFVPVRIVGNRCVAKESAIIVANHQSTLDVMLVGRAMCGMPHVWYTWSYYAKMPILGFFIRRIGFSLDLSEARSAAHDFLRGIRKTVDCSCHVNIFPEGGRFTDGKIHDFFRGFVILSRRMGRPVIPVCMPYNSLVYPPRAFWVHYHELLVIVGDPMTILPDETDEAFIKRVRTWFEQACDSVERNGA